MSDPLIYLHIVTPCLLATPLLFLVPQPSSPSEELPGIRPITIRTVTPRRAFTLALLSLLAITSFADTAILAADLLTANHRGDTDHLEGLNLASGLVYAVGGFLVWALAAILCEWRARWGDKGVLVLGSLGLVYEVPNLILLVLREIHASGSSNKIFAILSLPPSAIRLLLLPILLAVVLSPIIRFRPADETTGLLNGHDAESSTPNGREVAYGTFTGTNEENGNGKPDPSANASAAQTGANTPATTKPSIKIPKTLGEVKKEDKPLPLKEILARLRKLSPHLWPSTSPKLQFYCLLCVLLLAAGRVFQPLTPLALGRVIRSLTLNQNGTHSSSPWPPFIAYFVIRFFSSGSGVLYFLQQRLWIPVSQYTDREMMMMCFNHLLDLSLAYHTKRNTGEVLKMIDRGSAINNLFQTVLFTAIPTIFDIAISFGVFYYLYGGLIACITLAFMAVYVTFSVFMTQQRTSMRRLLMDKDVKQRGIVSDVLTNWESVKYFTSEHREATRFREAIVSYQETEGKWNVHYQLLYLIQNFILALGLMTGSLMIAYRVLHGTADAAEFVVFIQYFNQLSNPLDRLGWLYRTLNQNTTDAEKMFTLMAQATEVNDKPGAQDLVITDGVIEFDNVNFSYDGEVQALKGVSFKIGKGQSMALVGESGSGKSTILRLLYRFYDISSGHIYIDGQDISEVTQLSLRRAIGIVPQDSVLWNDTIGANISYGKEGADDEEIIAAAKAAKLHERILSFPEEYATIVGERGIRLSGGEKQRVSLARMFLKSPAILVLDEATSALDTETEREIQKALSDLAKGRSSLSIAHRLSTIINSDKIVVMKDGQVIENGGYQDLLDLNGAFATMWKKQILTEAEMLAQSDGVDVEEATKKLPIEVEFVEKGKGDGGSGGDSAELSRSDTGTKEPEADATEEKTGPHEDTIAGSSTDEAASKPIAAKQSPTTYAAAVKTPAADEGASQSAQTQDDIGKNLTEPSVTPDDVEEGELAALQPESQGAAPSPAELSPHVSSAKSPANPVIKSPSIPAPVPETADTIPELHSAEQEESPRASSASESPSENPDLLSVGSPSTSSTAVPFPGMPRISSSQSAQSDLSELDAAESTSDLHDLPSAEGKDKDKRRNRLSSLKGFVRRISDQGVTRSPSTNRAGSSGKSPMSEVDEATALLSTQAAVSSGEGEKKKKRLSIKKT